MAESISDMHEHICTGLAPSGQTSKFLHHRQWPEARTDLRDLPRATSRVSGSSLEEIPPPESRQGPVEPPGPSQSISEFLRTQKQGACFCSSRHSTYLQPYLPLCKQKHCTAHRDCQWAWKWGVNTEKIDYFPSWRTSVSPWFKFQASCFCLDWVSRKAYRILKSKPCLAGLFILIK